MGELGAETKSMATHAQTRRDYSPPRVTAPGTQTRQGITAGLTLPSLHSLQDVLSDCISLGFTCAFALTATVKTNAPTGTLTVDTTQHSSIALEPLAI